MITLGGIGLALGLLFVAMILSWFNTQKANIDRMKRLIGHLPGPKPNPYFGNIPDVLANQGNYGRAFHNLISKYGECFAFYGFIPDVVISNPEHIKLMFQSSNERGAAVSEPFVAETEIYGLFSMNYGERWKFHRRLISPIFQNTNLQKTDWIMIEKVQKLVQRWKNFAKNGPTEIESWGEFQKLTVDAIGHAAFGYDFKSLEGDQNKELIKAMNDMLDISVQHIIYASTPYWKWFPFLPENKRMLNAKNLVKNTITKLIETKMANYVKQKAAGQLSDERLDLLDLLLRTSQDSTDGQFDIEDIYGESMLFMIAGNETTAISLTFLFTNLALHPEVQKKLRSEIVQAIGNGTPTTAELNNIPYLEWVIKESMRLNPTVYIVRRELTEDVKINQYWIPRGAALVCSIESVHRDEKYYKDPNTFIPERWTREEEEKRPLHSFLPFGGGVRICVGKTFAMTEMKHATAMLIRDFEVEAKGPIPTTQQFVTKPKGPVPITIKMIKHN